jgi:hypothetical protein
MWHANPPHPKFNSRYCNKCELHWPYMEQFTACLICDAPTQAKPEEHDFKSIAAAFAHAKEETDRRNNYAMFEAYYIARLQRITTWEITRLQLASDATICDYLLKLETDLDPTATKEVPHAGPTQS